MLRKFAFFATAVVVFAVLAASPPAADAKKLAPVYNPEPIPVGKANAEQVRKAIRQALSKRGWAAKDQGPGHVVGTLSVRKHMAKVDIRFDGKTVRIKYKDSEELNYKKDGDAELIHPNYNKWVQNLENDINFALSDYN